MKKDSGIIYIMTNPSFPNWQKIGKTDNVEERLKTLNASSCTPLAFKIYATYEVDGNLSDVEKAIHGMIDQLNKEMRAAEKMGSGRIRKREFFAMTEEDAFLVIEKIALARGDKHKLKKYSTKNDTEEKIAELAEDVVGKERAARFSFCRKGIVVGEIIHFEEDNTITAEVAVLKPAKVLFEGKQRALSDLTRELKRRNGTATASEAYQGPMYFSYKGTKLTQLPDIEEE